MKVNGIDIRKYNAKQLTVDIQPPSFKVKYEWLLRAAQPIEFDTDIAVGHIKVSVYFKGKDRNAIIRSASEFLGNFTSSCDLELDGYKGKYRAFMTKNDYEKTILKSRYILNLEFDGFFYDDELEIVFDSKTSGEFYLVGSRLTPCCIEVYAKNALNNYKIKGFGNEDITIESLSAGKTVVIDGTNGLIMLDDKNAFDKVDLWEFPMIRPGKTALTFSTTQAKITIRYRPMWI